MEPELNNDFIDAGVDLNALDDVSTDGRPTVLDKLGPAHFRSKGFSFMGFLQTVYDHVAEQTARHDVETDATQVVADTADEAVSYPEAALVESAPADGAEALPTDLSEAPPDDENTNPTDTQRDQIV